MTKHSSGRREFLKALTALGAMGLPVTGGLRASSLAAADATAAAADLAYDPGARLDVTVSEVELRRTAAGRTLMARIYQPTGAGPFPTVLDLHGGAWNGKDRHAEEPMDRAIAARAHPLCDRR